MLLLVIFSLYIRKRLSLVPSKIQLASEIVVGGLFSLFESITGNKTKKFFPFLATLFLLILFLNWTGLLPGVGTIGLKEAEHGSEVFIPLFRAGSADLNTTLAFAIVTVLVIQYFGIKTLGKEYLGRFFNFKNPIMFFVGFLELISEGTKIISFAFRLFGNIFAGEVLLTVIAFLIPLIVPLPFLAMELFVGLIQALVFSMLAAVFLNQATTSHEH